MTRPGKPTLTYAYHDAGHRLRINDKRVREKRLDMEEDAMLWPVAVPPINLNDVSRDINDHARMELIKRLVCDSGDGFDPINLLKWLTDFIRDNRLSEEGGQP